MTRLNQNSTIIIVVVLILQYVSLCYRSPSSSNYNNNSLLDQLELAVSRTNTKHVMILGDFNHHNTDYEHEYVSACEDTASTRFFNKTQELCLIQYVKQPTRIRQWQQPSTLDYMLIDEHNLIEDLSYSEPLCMSDHVALQWNLLLEVNEPASCQDKKNYWKSDYNKITIKLSEISWNEKLQGKSPEEMWLTFKQTVGKLSDLHIPTKEKHQKKKGHCISKSKRKEIQKCSKAWQKYYRFQSSSNYEAYKSRRNKVTSLIRADNFKGNLRRIYTNTQGNCRQSRTTSQL